MKIICFQDTIAGFNIELIQTSDTAFTVNYGLEKHTGLTYEQAAKELGEAIMHASACEGVLQMECD